MPRSTIFCEQSVHYIKNLLCIEKQTQTIITPKTIFSIFKDITLKYVDTEVLTITCKMKQEPENSKQSQDSNCISTISPYT